MGIIFIVESLKKIISRNFLPFIKTTTKSLTLEMNKTYKVHTDFDLDSMSQEENHCRCLRNESALTDLASFNQSYWDSLSKSDCEE